MNASGQRVRRPEWLEFLAFRLVMVEQQSIPAVAERLQLDFGQMGQILGDVDRYLLSQTPGADDDVQARKQKHFSEQLAAERLSYLHRLALIAFKASEQVKTRLDKAALADGKTELHKEVVPGHPRYLIAAARITQMASKLPLPRLQSLAMEACFRDEPGEPEPAESEKTAHTPSAEDCSPVEETAAIFAALEQQENAVSHEPANVSVAGVDSGLLAKMARAGTVHPVDSASHISATKQSRRDAFFRRE